MPNEFKIRNGLVVEGGSTIITGSLIVAGGITGSFSGSVVGAFPFTGSANITGSLGVIGPSTFSGSVGIADNLTLSTGGFIYGDTTNPYIQLNNTLGSKLAYGPTNYVDVGGPTTIVNANVNIIRFRNTRIVATVNTFIGAPNVETDPTARLQVRGSGATSATNGLRVENSSTSASLLVRDDGRVFIGEPNVTTNWQIFPGGLVHVTAGGSIANFTLTAGAISVPNSLVHFGGTALSTGGTPTLQTTRTNTASTSLSAVQFNFNITNSTGSSLVHNGLNIVNTINNTSTYSGTVRGIFYDPILTSISGTIHRAIETTSGDILFQSGSSTLLLVSGSGNVGIGTGTPNARLDVNGNTIISGSLTVGTGSIGASENTITLGARDAINEGGQIGFNAPGGTYTSASFIDNWQNKARILKGNNTTSTGLIAQWDIHTTQMQLPGYTAASSFPGTATANLAVDSGGNVITVSTSGGTVFPYTGNAVITGSLTATTGFIAPNTNGAMYLRGGDDVELWDINISNHLGVYGQQDATIASIKLGSGGGIISGRNNNIGIGTTTPNSTLDVSGSAIISGSLTVTNGITGSLLGTASFATSASQAISASFVPNTFVQNGNSFGAQAVLGTNDNQNLAFETNGVVRMFISSSGRVGIGTTGPSQSLQVNGAIMTRTADPVFIMEDTSNIDNNAFYMGAFFDTGFPISYGSIAINRNPATGIFRNTSRAASQINFESNNNYGSIRFYTTATNNVTPDLAVTITPQRNMLIAPAAAGDEALARLHVRGSGTTSATNTLLVQNSTPTNILTVRDDGQTSINGNTAITGSFTVITGSNVELQVLNTGVRLGNVIGDAHTVTGSFSISGSFSVSGSSTFNGTVRINNQTGGTPTEQGTSAGVVSSYWGTEDGKFLSTPSTWLTINLGGTNYFIPAYV